MQRFTPNTILYDRFLLKEELSYESQNGQQVWAIQDSQTGQALIARLHADGRVEWFNDNRSPVSVPEQPPAPIQVAPRAIGNPVRPRVNPEPATTSAGRQTMTFLISMLLAGGLVGAYFYRQPLLAYVQSFRLPITSRSDSATQTYTDSTQAVSESPSGTLPDSKPAPVEPILPDAAGAAPISVPQAVRLLSLLKQIPPEKHPAIFADARQAFVRLRQASGHRSSIDSLYTMCSGRGAQSFLLHQQNGDGISKQYAIEWYQLAYTLKPSASLQERLNRLKNVVRNPYSKQSATRTRGNESLFMTDPEVNK